MVHYIFSLFIESVFGLPVGDDYTKLLGLEERCAVKGGNGTLGCVPIGEWRDVIVVPPLANITVRLYVVYLK